MANRKTTAGGAMDDGDPFPQHERLRRRMQQLIMEARRIWKSLNRLEERADALVQELQSLLDEPAEPAAKGVTNPRRPGASIKQETRRLETLARQGVGELGIEHGADGREWVRVDHGTEFELPPTLAALLSALAVDNHRGNERLVGWKTKGEIAELLEKMLERSYDDHAIAQLIYRLRIELFKRGGVNPHLVQTSPRHGARFALRRKEGAWV